MKEKNNHPILKIIFIILIVVFSFLLYSRFVSTSGLKIKEYKIINSNIPDKLVGLKIVHLSDVHYGRIINNQRLEIIVEKINSINPDIVVITGDLIDNDTKLKDEDRKALTDILSKIDVSIDKYAIRGNHDYYFDTWKDIINDSGFINLDNNYQFIYTDYQPMLITGLSSLVDEEDVVTRYNKIKENINAEQINSVYNILLVHETDFIDNIDINNYHLILGGHSHNGQVRLPFIGAIIKPKESQKYYDEYYKLGNIDFYISSGLGTSELDFRFFNKPSFNLYRLNNK